MSHCNIEDGKTLTLTCNFCGSQSTDVHRCTGCGATSLKRLDEPLTAEQQTLVDQGVKAQQHINIIGVILAIGLLLVAWTMRSVFLSGTAAMPQTPPLAQQLQRPPPPPHAAITTASSGRSTGSSIMRAMPVQIQQAKPSLDVQSLFKTRTYKYPVANTTWGERFNPSQAVPDSGFAAYYFNTAAPGRLVHQENVDTAKILYADDFHGISPADFGAYWVGKFELEKTQLVELALKQNKSKSRIIIDGTIVHESSLRSDPNDPNRKKVVRLAKGEHLIEVELINQWHNSADFSVEIKPFSDKLTRSNIRTLLANNIASTYNFHYVGIEKSTNTDKTIKLNIQKSSEQIVLVLSSRSAVNWYLANPHKTNIAAIVYGSASQQESTVLGDINRSTLLLKSRSRIGDYTSPPGCACTPAGPLCHLSRKFIDTRRKVEGLGHGQITGMSNRESASAIKVPQRAMSPGLFEVELRHHTEEQERLAKRCNRLIPDFENLFSRK